MTRLRVLWRALLGVTIAGAMVAGTSGAALAQTTPTPVIDSYPRRVDYRAGATIKGHMQDGTPGQEVKLQRKSSSGEWKTIDVKATDSENRVQFHRADLVTTHAYRLVHRDATTSMNLKSDTARISVRSVMRFRAIRDDVMSGRRITFAGSLYPAIPGREVVIQQRLSGEWRTIERARVSEGRFSGAFRYYREGRRRLRARFTGDGNNLGTREGDWFRVYDPDPATWYGPGFYGNRTACGQRLGYSTLGVAHRSLPCGTKVALLYNGRTITVPVIDRGPYSHADWDLTSETADRLGFKQEGSGTVGVSH